MTEKNLWKLKKIYFYLTEGCNLKCRHCWLSPEYEKEKGQSRFLSYELFSHIVGQGKEMGIQGVKLTGGEPLIHPHIIQIIAFLKEQELKLTIETNGVLCSEEMSRMISEVPGAFISVSLDAASADIHEWVRGVKGCFNDSVNGVKNLVSAGMKPQIIMTIMKQNREQMEDMVAMAQELGAGSVKFNIVMPTGRGENIHEFDETLSVPDLISTGVWVQEELSRKYKIKVHYDHPLAFRPLGRMFGAEDGDGCACCGIKGIMGVLYDGSYALCGIGNTVKELVFGHASNDSLADVWENNAVLNQIRSGLPGELTGVCGECLMNSICLGSCIAQNYYRSKDLWAPFWLCEEAFRLGLFPETRVKGVSL